MLRPDVVEAVRAGQFHVWAIDTVDEGIELLTGFGLLGQGLTTQQIALRMHVSPKTVETYRARIKEKLGVGSVTALIRQATEWALENG